MWLLRELAAGKRSLLSSLRSVEKPNLPPPPPPHPALRPLAPACLLLWGGLGAGDES